MVPALARNSRLAATRGRLALWCAAIVFLVQLFAAAHHDHELAAQSQHCVSCALHAQPHAAPPDTTPRIAPFAWTLLHALAAPPAAPALPAGPAHLRPPAHAPPSFPHSL